MRDGDLFPKVEAGDGADRGELLFDFVEAEAVSGDLGEALGAARQVEKSLSVQAPEIAGFEASLHLVALAEVGPGHGVAQHDVGAFVHHRPTAPGGRASALVVDDRQSAAGERDADRARLPGKIGMGCRVAMRGEASVCPYMTKNRPPRWLAKSCIFVWMRRSSAPPACVNTLIESGASPSPRRASTA